MFHRVDFSHNVWLSLVCLFIFVIFIFRWFRLVSPGSYNIATLIATLNKFHKQTTFHSDIDGHLVKASVENLIDLNK